MSLLEISETENVGERRWGVSLIDDNGVPVLRNITQLPKGVALSTAKTLKHKGPAAPFVGTGSVIPENASFSSIIHEATSVAFTMLLSHLRCANSSFKSYLRRYDACFQPIKTVVDGRSQWQYTVVLRFQARWPSRPAIFPSTMAIKWCGRSATHLSGCLSNRDPRVSVSAK